MTQVTDLKLLQVGGYGKVYSAIDKSKVGPQRDIAIKKMYFKQDYDIFAALKELNTLRVFKHPHLISLRSFSLPNLNRNIKISSKYMEIYMDLWSSDLHCLIKSTYPKGLPLDLSLKLMAQILSGLNFLHSKGIYHLDLKPANILVNLDGDQPVKVSICDFGCSTYYYFDNVINIGSVNCRPPENFVDLVGEKLKKRINQAAGVGCYYSSKTDIWACGALLIFMLTGKTLLYPEDNFTSRVPLDRLEQFMKNPPVYIKFMLEGLDIPEVSSLCDLLLSLLNPDPNQRPSIGKIFEHKLFKEYQEYAKLTGSSHRPLRTNINLDHEDILNFRDISKKVLIALKSTDCSYRTAYTAADLAVRAFTSLKKFTLLDMVTCVRIAYIFLEDKVDSFFSICHKEFSMRQINIHTINIVNVLQGYLVINSPFERCSLDKLDNLLEAYLDVKQYFQWKGEPKIIADISWKEAARKSRILQG